MIFPVVFFSDSMKNGKIALIIASVCQDGITKSLFRNISVHDLKVACSQDFLYNVFDQFVWSVIRLVFQVRIFTVSWLMEVDLLRCDRALDVSAGQRAGSPESSSNGSMASRYSDYSYPRVKGLGFRIRLLLGH